MSKTMVVTEETFEVTEDMLTYWLAGTDDSTDMTSRCEPVVDCDRVFIAEEVA